MSGIIKAQKKDRNYKQKIFFAGFWLRLAAFAIDLVIAVILGIVASVILEVLLEIAGISKLMPTVDKFFGTIVIWGYFIYLTYTYDATFGKKLVGIKVISEKEGKLNFLQIIFRETLGKMISFAVFGAGFFTIGMNKQKQGFHDWISKTAVIRETEDLKRTQKLVYYLTLILLVLAFIIFVLGGFLWLMQLNSTRIEKRNAYAQVMVFELAVALNGCRELGGESAPPESVFGGGKICSIEENVLWPRPINGFSYGEFAPNAVSLTSEDGEVFQCSVSGLQCNFD